MLFSDNEIATYLFCAPLQNTKTTPLTILEWNVTVKSLANHGRNPDFLLTCIPSNLQNILTEATEAQKSKIVQKVEKRQKLGVAMIELEEAINQGYNIVFRSQMPFRLKKLKLNTRPAFLYFIGDINILNTQNALGVVGARDALPEELAQVTEICQNAAKNDIIVISGGARGVDSAATDAALRAGGKVVIFPSEGLSRWSRRKEVRQYIQKGQLLIMSTQSLGANFTSAYAMQRNKYIHATGDATLVASSKVSSAKKSGTWEGVLENIKAKWSPLYVLGASEGVEKLKEMRNATAFTSIEDIFLHKPIVKEAQFKQELQILITKAQVSGVGLETIEKILINEVNQLVSKTTVGQEKESDIDATCITEPAKQMSLFDV